MTTKALDKLIALEKEAKAFGFIWPDKEMIVQQMLSESTAILILEKSM